MSHTAAALLALLALPSVLRAQEDVSRTVRGVVVVGDSARPVGGAWVSIADSDEGVLTGLDGRFRLRDVPLGPAVMTVDLLGYAPQVIVLEGNDSVPDLTIRLEPEPVVLEGLRVVFDRFERRRNATATSVRYFDETDLLRATQGDVVRFLRSRAGLFMTSCRSMWSMSSTCIWYRGSVIEPTVYIDERRAFGLDELRTYRPEDFYMVEVYARGRHIRAYTRWFMRDAAERRLQPIPLFW